MYLYKKSLTNPEISPVGLRPKSEFGESDLMPGSLTGRRPASHETGSRPGSRFLLDPSVLKSETLHVARRYQASGPDFPKLIC
jgi:hypothetical protein